MSPAIRAGGNCNLTLVGMNITAPVAIEASGNARVTIQGGAINGSTHSIVARGNAQVTNLGAVITGPAQRSGNAVVNGVP